MVPDVPATAESLFKQLCLFHIRIEAGLDGGKLDHPTEMRCSRMAMSCRSSFCSRVLTRMYPYVEMVTNPPHLSDNP